MTTDDCIIGLCCRVDERMGRQPKHPQARLHPSEIVTRGLLFALTGVGQRPFAPLVSRLARAYAAVPPLRRPS